MKTERASLAAEIVLLVPCLFAIVLLVVYAGAVTRTSFQVQHAATSAARAASMVSLKESQNEALRVVIQLLKEHDAGCVRARVDAERIRLQESSAVKVSVSCVVSARDISLLHVGGVTVTKSATSVIDRYRRQ